jgi:molybdopterin-guanine dinucleotide biosynthesis protein A
MKALILAGGENKRLPVIKGFLEIKGRRIIELNIELLKGIFDCVIISTNDPGLYFYLGVPMVGDIVKYKGPMTGILSALVTLEVPDIFVTACDMPFINPKLIRYIVDKWTKNKENLSLVTRHSSLRGGWDAAIPVFDNKSQPLFGIYSRKVIRSMEETIKNGSRSLREFLKKLNVLYISEDEVRTIDPEGRSFVNINTLEDYEKAMKG